MAKPQDAPVGEEQDGAKAVAASNARSIDSSVLQLFWDLAALESSRRQAATEELVKYLCAAQAAHDQENGTTEVPTPPDSASDKEKAEERPRLTAIAETERFWEEVVEGSMVHSSHERKYLSMELFSLLLPHMPGTRVSALFSHSFMKLLVNNMSAKDNFLHKRSMKCAYDIVQFVITGSASPEAKVAITASLQQYGGGRFDQLTGTATVASLLATQDTSRGILLGMLVPGLDAQAAATAKKPRKPNKARPASKAEGAEGAEGEEQDGADDEKEQPEGPPAANGKEDGSYRPREPPLAVVSGMTWRGVGGEDPGSVNLHVKRLMVTFCRPLEASGAAPREDDGVDAAVAATGKRMWAIEQLGAVWKSKSGDQAVQLAIMRFLLVHCAFSVHGDPKPMEQELQIDGGLPSPELPENVRERCGQRLLQLMASATNQYVNKGKLKKAASVQLQAKIIEQVVVVAKSKSFLLQAGAAIVTQILKGYEGSMGELLEEAPTLAAMGLISTLLCSFLVDVCVRQDLRAGVRQDLRACKCALDSIFKPSGGAATPESQSVGILVFANTVGAMPLQLTGALAVFAVTILELAQVEAHNGGWGLGVGPDGSTAQDVLMDVLLALLARPSAPLRDAAERVFRGWVNDVTGTGVKDMLRVLDKKGKRQRLRARGSKRKGKNSEGDVVEREGSGDERDDDIDDDSDDSDEDVLSDEDEEDEEEEEEEEEEVEDEDEDEEEAEAPSLVPRPGPGDGVDKANGEEEEEDMDDEAMFKMDALLGKCLEARTWRAWSRRCWYVDTRALKAAEAPEPHGGHHLVKRISALITSGVCKGRDRPTEGGEGMPVDSLVQQLKKCSRLASRSSSKPVCGAAAACCTFIMRQISAAAPEGNPEASACLGQMLKEYFERKTCRLPRSFFETTAWRVPWAPAVLLPIITAATTGARNDYLQVEDCAKFAETNCNPPVSLFCVLSMWSAVMLAAALKPLEGKPAKVTAVVKRHMDPLGRALLGLLKTKFGKAARRTEALKAVCGVLERLPRVFEGQKVSALMDGEVLVALEDAAAELVAGGEGAQAPKKLTSSLTRLQVILGTHQAGKGKKRPEAPTQSTPKADKRQKTESEAPKTPKTPKRRKDDVSTVAEKGTSEKAKSTTKKQKKEK
eukprot:gene4176-5155_t